jgi:uncharacterized membrane protein YoaK (UPF0700 family)
MPAIERAALAPRTREAAAPATVRDLLLAGLTISSGAIDAISFLALGKVFTAFMTGNLVFLGLGIADTGGTHVVRVVVALAAFSAGVFGGTRIVGDAPRAGAWSPRWTAALGVALVSEAAFLVVWLVVSGHPGDGSAGVLVGLFAVAMGIQSSAVMALGVKGIFTTASTGTVMFLMHDLAMGSHAAASDRTRLAGILVALVAGAAAGGLLLVHARDWAPVLPLVVTALVVAGSGVASAHDQQRS